MAEKSNKATYWLIAIIVFVVALLILFRNPLSKWVGGLMAANKNDANNTQQTVTPANSPQLNWNLVLKQGVTGEEVKVLQGWLGVATDGIFGPITEGALQQRRGVVQTTLNQFAAGSDASGAWANGHSAAANAWFMQKPSGDVLVDEFGMPDDSFNGSGNPIVGASNMNTMGYVH